MKYLMGRAGSLVIFLVVAVTAMLAFPSAARAGGGEENISILGFSSSGKYAAVARFGETEGYKVKSTVFFLNVPKNDFVSQRFSKSRPSPPPNGVWDVLGVLNEENLEKAKILVKRFKIAKGNSGYVPKIHNTSTQENPNQISFSSKNGGSYMLDLILRKRGGGKYCRRGQTIKIFTLILTNQDGKRKILQKDRKLYKSRKCPFDYKFSKYNPVHIYKNYLVVFIASRIPGEKGPLNRQLVVTGTLN